MTQPEALPLKDSGNRRKFETGAVRDVTNFKGCFHLLPPYAIWRWARHMEKGNIKYGPRNWEKGIPLSSFYDSASRHWFEVLMGLTDEDHATAALWNVGGFLETKIRIDLGLLPKSLDDMPYTYTSVQDKLAALQEQLKEQMIQT